MSKQKEEEEKKNRYALLLQERKKIIRNLVLLGAAFFAVLIGVFTMAWFAMNKKNETNGMGVQVQGENFDITNISGSKEGIFKNPYHEAAHEEGAMYWKMTATNNLKNYNEYVDDEHPGDQGIHPGTEGVISFNVIPKKDSVNLKFDFEIIGYQKSIDDKNTSNTEDDELVMTPLSQLSNSAGTVAQNLLNGHILLFEHRDTVTENGVTTVTYSTPICSDADMHRIMNRRVTGKNTATQIDIYWVWPNTLSTLVDSSASGVTTNPFCQDSVSYTAITNNIESYPQYYLKGASSGDGITVTDLGSHYIYYGDMYDQGDNVIGMSVHYLLIKLSVTEETAGGGGS